MGKSGAHVLDLCRWALRERALPARVLSIGGRFGSADDGQTPNTQLAWFDYPVPVVIEVRGLGGESDVREASWVEGFDRLGGVHTGVRIECMGGALHVPLDGDPVAFDVEGRELRRWSGGADHLANFLEAVRTGDRTALRADVLDGHVSSSLAHIANASYRLGAEQSPRDMDSIVGERPPLGEALERMRLHLLTHGIDPIESPLRTGPWLEIDPQTERFLLERARAFERGEYREPFVVPEIV